MTLWGYEGIVLWLAVAAVVFFAAVSCDGGDRRVSVSTTVMSPMQAEMDCVYGYTVSWALPADHTIV